MLGRDWELASVLSAQPEVVRETVREPGQRPEVGRADLDRIERDGRSFVGTSVVYMNQGSRLELFVGLDEQVRRRVLDGAPMTHDAQTRPVSRLVKGRALLYRYMQEGWPAAAKRRVRALGQFLFDRLRSFECKDLTGRINPPDSASVPDGDLCEDARHLEKHSVARVVAEDLP